MPGRSHIGVTGGQHGGKAGGLGLAPLAFAGLFKMPVIAHFLESALAINLLLQPAQGFVHRFAFFKSYFGQKFSLPLRVSAGPAWPALLNESLPCPHSAPVSTAKNTARNGAFFFGRLLSAKKHFKISDVSIVNWSLRICHWLSRPPPWRWQAANCHNRSERGWSVMPRVLTNDK